MQENIKTSLTKAQFSTPLYSPRTTYSNHLREISSLKTNMIINIDKYILGNLKSEFQKRGKEISMLQFIFFSKKYLKDWNPDLYGRDIKMQECLIDVWKEIDVENKGKITWEEFNSKIIETSLNLKSLSNNAGIQAPSFKEFSVAVLPAKYENPISKLVYIKGNNKMAFFREQAIQIQFFATESISTSQSLPQTKPLILPQQELKVETMIKVKEKKESVAGEKVVKQPQKIIKKDLKVSSYKNTVIDLIYLDDQKYDMLIVSSSDKYVRGYNVSNIIPAIAVQPQNQDEQMIHQFPVEIYTMAWDSINEVLYATGKNPKIYQWVIKTDSEREMFDSRGHDKMISAMLMMPKLQLLASGGYDGKLILWDTVGQVIKCKYEEHTRAISSITFHEGLILLFTSSFDHKICIWNPYITSLIHKIDNTLNVISIQIIPNTNYLLALDCGGTVKIREINRFTQVASFSIFRSESTEDAQSFLKQQKNDKELSISMCSKRDGAIQYYFGTEKIIGYEYFEIQKSSIVGGNISQMKYNELSLKLFTPLKNHVIVWNLLTGRVEEIFYDMSENDITSIELAPSLGLFICGDVDGNIVQRRMSNGFLMKNLGKMKGSINKMIFHKVERNEKQKSLKKSYFLFCTTEEGQANVFKCHPKTEFTLYKQFSMRQDFNILNGNLVAIEYFGQKNVLMMKLNTNQVLFVDVEKKSLLIKIELGEVGITGMNVIDHKDTHYFTILNKSGQITGFYLPPHPKKFKPSCCIQIQGLQKSQYSLYGPKSHLMFVSTEQNELHCIKFEKKFLEVDNYIPTINIQWKLKILKRVISMTLIQNEQILVCLTQSEDITFILVENGEVICKLRQDFKTQPQIAKEPEPILHFKQKNNQIYIPDEDKAIKIDHQELEETKLQRIIDPNFFLNFLKKKNIKNFRKISSGGWELNLNFQKFVDNQIKEIQQIEQQLNSGVQKIFQKRGPTQIEKKIQKALELQKKWQREKDFEGSNEQIRNQHSMTKLERNSMDFKKNVSRAVSISILWKHKQTSRKTQNSMYKQKNQLLKENDMSVTKSKFSDLQKADISKLRSDPLYRLGQALKSVNIKDKKAENFIELAKKKEGLKLPKIYSQKIKL